MKKIIYLIALLTLSLQTMAHTASDSYIYLQQNNQELQLQWDIALTDLDAALDLDTDRDYQISGKELKANASVITDYALKNLSLSHNNQPCDLKTSEPNLIERGQQQYFSIRGISSCDTLTSLTLSYTLFSELDPSHRGLIQFNSGNHQQTAILGATNQSWTISIEKENYWITIKQFIWQGVWHIFIGLDHILFLLTLLLPATLMEQSNNQRSLKQTLIETVKLVTCFTIAHSITLSLSVLNIVTLPAKLVEVVIALSIIIVASNNIRPLFNHSRLWFAFGFGLIHGFGFANVLLELNLETATLALALMSFNIGVEIGQVAIVALFLPLFYIASKWSYYGRVVIPSISIASASIAALWVVERLTQYQL